VIYLPGLWIDFRNLPIVEWFGYGKFAGYARYLLLAYFSAVAAAAISLAISRARSVSEERWDPALLELSLFRLPLVCSLRACSQHRPPPLFA